MPALLAQGVPRVASLSLLAPAVRADLFSEKIVPLVTSGAVGAHHHFTMEDDAERDDNVALVYRKSLLYSSPRRSSPSASSRSSGCSGR